MVRNKGKWEEIYEVSEWFDEFDRLRKCLIDKIE